MPDNTFVTVAAEVVCASFAIWYMCVSLCRIVTSKHRLALASEPAYTLLTPERHHLKLAHIALPV